MAFASNLWGGYARRKDNKTIEAPHGNLTLLQAAAFYGLGQEIEALLTVKRYREHVNDRDFHSAWPSCVAFCRSIGCRCGGGSAERGDLEFQSAE